MVLRTIPQEEQRSRFSPTNVKMNFMRATTHDRQMSHSALQVIPSLTTQMPPSIASKNNIDLNPLDGGEERAFARALERRGLCTFVVPVRRQDWLQVASAIFTADFWKGTCRPDGPAYGWYLQKASDFFRSRRG